PRRPDADAGAAVRGAGGPAVEHLRGPHQAAHQAHRAGAGGPADRDAGGGAAVLLPLVWGLAAPTAGQGLGLVFFGALQRGLAYWRIARGSRVVSRQEAGTITLLEPLVNPLWAYLVWPEEAPPPLTYVGGAFILGALAWRYWPRRAAP